VSLPTHPHCAAGCPFQASLGLGVRRLHSQIRSSPVGFAAVTDAANLDGIGIGADEEEPAVANAQPKFFSSLESFHVTRTRVRKAMQRRENMHSGGLA
jgi:hypothetical protein